MATSRADSSNAPLGEPSPRLAEVVAGLALATDLGTGKPLDHSLRSCLIAMAIGRSIKMTDGELSDLFYLSLVQMLGCTVDAHQGAQIMGDEVAVAGAMAALDLGNQLEMVGWMLREFAADESPIRRTRMLLKMLSFSPARKGMLAGHCEVAQMLATRLGLGPSVQHQLGFVYERWDGKGLPAGVRGELSPLPVRVVLMARDLEIFNRVTASPACAEMLRQRRGGAYDPDLVDHVLDRLSQVLTIAETLSPWQAVLDQEPGPRPVLRRDAFDAALKVVADFTDLKSPYTLGHSTAVSYLAAAAAERCGLSAGQRAELSRAALVHDLGRVAVTSAIWDKPGALTDVEWEKVRLYPYYGERVLERSQSMSRVAKLAGAHHERLDGSGYHRGSSSAALSMPARILAAADTYQAMTEARSYRPGLGPAEAARQLENEVRAGRLDAEAAASVLATAGLRAGKRRRARPAGLTEREVEILQLVARGHPNKTIARALSISPKTVEHHVAHIYDKVCVSTRAGATLYATQHGLVIDEIEDYSPSGGGVLSLHD